MNCITSTVGCVPQVLPFSKVKFYVHARWKNTVCDERPIASFWLRTKVIHSSIRRCWPWEMFDVCLRGFEVQDISREQWSWLWVEVNHVTSDQSITCPAAHRAPRPPPPADPQGRIDWLHASSLSSHLLSPFSFLVASADITRTCTAAICRVVAPQKRGNK